MIPNILYTIFNRASTNNNNSNNNNSNNNNSNNNDPNSNNNNLNDNNDENDTGSRSIHVNSHSNFAQLEQQIASQLRDQSRELQQQQQQQQQQQGVGQASTTTPTSTNQSVFINNNLRFGQPVCILRAPEDSNFPSANVDQNSSESDSSESYSSESQQQPLSTIFLPHNYIPPQSGSSNEPEIVAKDYDDTSKGVFTDKFSLNLLPVEGNNNLFTNRISYNTQTDAYYENGNLSNKYLKNWKAGAYQWDNIEMKVEYDWMKTYLARSPSDDKMNDDGEISWKFDYRIGGYLINSLKIRFSFGTFDNDASVKWFIKPLPTMKNQVPEWNEIQFDPYAEYRHKVNEIKDLTQFIKDEYGFILKAHLSGGEEDHVIWQKTQLFRQDWNRSLTKDVIIENDETFGLDVKVELRPDVIIDPLPELSVSNDESNTSSELFILNDESTSDFVIHYNVSADDDCTDSENISNSNISFHVHSNILSKRSDYFNALLESKMIESQSKSLTLTDQDISYESLEFILNYLYNGNPPNIKSFDEWTTLLRYASRFLIPTLIQMCEKALRDYLNHDNLNEIESIASEYGAYQLLQYCRNFEPPKNN